VVDEKRLNDLLKNKTTPKDRPEAEVVGYRDVIARIHTSFEHFSITPETILKMHRDMLRRTDLPAGVWKKGTIRLRNGYRMDGGSPVLFSSRHVRHLILFRHQPLNNSPMEPYDTLDRFGIFHNGLQDALQCFFQRRHAGPYAVSHVVLPYIFP